MPVAKKQATKEAGGRNKGGRPKQETTVSLENRVLEYFEHCESLGRFPTESGMLLHLGLYGEKALGALAGARIGIVVTEGTFGSKSLPRESAHLCGQNCCEQLRALAQAGALAEGARAYITHINQENEWNTAQYQAYMDKNAPIPVTIARDGMKIG